MHTHQHTEKETSTMGSLSAAFVLLYIGALVVIAVYLIVLATKLVSAQLRTAKALEVIANRLPDPRVG